MAGDWVIGCGATRGRFSSNHVGVPCAQNGHRTTRDDTLKFATTHAIQKPTVTMRVSALVSELRTPNVHPELHHVTEAYTHLFPSAIRVPLETMHPRARRFPCAKKNECSMRGTLEIWR
ncbi:unnamed protein product [Scytosiphon promiscuus]